MNEERLDGAVQATWKSSPWMNDEEVDGDFSHTTPIECRAAVRRPRCSERIRAATGAAILALRNLATMNSRFQQQQTVNFDAVQQSTRAWLHLERNTRAIFKWV